MAEFARDSFTGSTGTALTSHTGELGASWSVLTDYPTLVLTANNAVRPAAVAGTHGNTASGTPPGAHYGASCTLLFKSDWSSCFAGLLLRSSGGNLYEFVWRGSVTGFSFFKRVSTVWTQVGTDYGYTPTTNERLRLAFRVVGTKLQGYINGVLVLEATDSAISSAASPGVVAGNDLGTSSDTTGVHIEDFRAESLAASAVLVHPGVRTRHAYDDFERADANPLNGSWIEPTGVGFSPAQILSGVVRATVNGGNNAAYWSADTFDTNYHWGEIIDTTGNGDASAMVKMTTDGYGVVYFPVDLGWFAFAPDGGTTSLRGFAIPSWAQYGAGSRIRIVASGHNPTRLQLYVNGVLVDDFSTSDAIVQAGTRVGAYLYSTSDGIGEFSAGPYQAPTALKTHHRWRNDDGGE